MTIHLPKDVESSIRAEVRSGHFATADDAVAEAWRAFLRQQSQVHPGTARTEDEIDRQMLADGLLTQLPNTANDVDDEDEAPVTIQGETLSETIIRERR
jgi:Arc/MetJ-type ribon-helix-helix transcriptional regulator